MAFPAFAITAHGLDMQAQAELGGTLTFTRIALGAGSAANPSAATAMVDQRMTSDIQEFDNLGTGRVRLRAVFSNLALAVGFSITEVGVFALDPTTGVERLHSYTRTSLPDYPPDYMPPSSGPTILEQIFDAIIAIGSAANVTVVIDETVIIATKEDARWGQVAAKTVYTTGTAQTHTFQAGIREVEIEGLAGGGGGGGAAYGGVSGGGAAGGMFKARITDPLGSLTYSVGAGGNGGAAGLNAGSSGGNTTVVHGATTYVAGGGSGGGSVTSGYIPAFGGAGAAGSGGYLNFPGAPGGNGHVIVNINTQRRIHGGAGGSSAFGSGGRERINQDGATASAGEAASGYGSGGSGCATLHTGGSGDRAGGNGSGGFIIITEFY